MKVSLVFVFLNNRIVQKFPFHSVGFFSICGQTLVSKQSYLISCLPELQLTSEVWTYALCIYGGISCELDGCVHIISSG